MCGLCGMFDIGRRWLDAADKLDPSARGASGLVRLAIVRRVLAPARVTVDDFEGASFVLRGPTGATELVDNLFDLWRRAETLGMRRIDPLDDAQRGIVRPAASRCTSSRASSAAERRRYSIACCVIRRGPTARS